MPRIELRDAFGTSYQLSSTEPELIERWFREWLPRLYPPEMPEELGAPVIMAWPLPSSSEPTGYDWVQDTRVLGLWCKFTRDPGAALDNLAKLRKQLAQQVTDLDQEKVQRHGG